MAEPEGRCIRGCQLQLSPDQWAFPALDCADVPPRPAPTWGQLLPRDTLLALWGLSKRGNVVGGELLLVSHSDMVEPGKGLLPRKHLNPFLDRQGSYVPDSSGTCT